MNTLESIFLNYGQLFENFEHFKKNFLDITKEKYTAMLYITDIDELDDNYLKWRCPNMDKYKNIKVEY